MATLVYTDSDGIDRSVSIGSEPVTVGRSAECTIRSEDSRLSRMHARFFFDQQGSLWIEDLGSANGIYVGPNRISRTHVQVPVGELILIGNLMIRLLPASGTLPPPVGLHGILAQWLDMERKARAGAEDERTAYGKRMGELHDELRIMKEAQNLLQQEEHTLRTELDLMRRQSQADLEIVRLELAKAKEDRIVASTSAGLSVAEKLAEADMVISGLQNELITARAAASTAQNDPKAKLLQEQLAAMTARAEKADKDLGIAQIRAQGAERNFQAANMQTAKAETKAVEAQRKVDEAAAAHAKLAAELATANEKVTQLEARLGAGAAPVQAAESRASKLASELAEMTQQFETARARLAEIEGELASAKEAAQAAETGANETRIELDEAVSKANAGWVAADTKAHEAATDAARDLAAARARVAELEARLSTVGGAEAEVAAARKEREEARDKTSNADKRIAEAFARADDAVQRASAADTMAKAMAKDVAEALRRAADVELKARSVARELDGAHKRAESAEKRDGERAAATRDAEKRATEAEAKLAQVQSELGTKLAQVQKELTDKLALAERDLLAKAEQTVKDVTAKADQIARELAAERSSAMSLVDRKTHLERELSEARTQLADLEQRVDLAEGKAAEYEITIEQLEEKVQDLEAGVAVEQTAASSSIEEARDKIKKLEEQLAESKAASKTATKTAAGLERRLDAIETELATVKAARAAVESELATVRAHVNELERSMDEYTSTSSADRSLIESVEARAKEAEAKLLELAPLKDRADAAELAIGRANGLQRQLDESLQKLSWLERDVERQKARNPEVEADLSKQVGIADARAREAEARARDAEQKFEAQLALARDSDVQVREAEARANELEAQARAAEARAAQQAGQLLDAQARVAQLETHSREVEIRAKEIETRARDIETRAKEAAERIVDAERRARDNETKLADALRRAQEAEERIDERGTAERGDLAGIAQLQQELADAEARIAEMESELEKADNVRQFAANTEREIAALERELRDQKAKVTQITLERDRLESQLRDLRDDSETTSRQAPRTVRAESEGGGQADLTRYTALVARASELEQKLIKLEKEDERLRRTLTEAEQKVAAQSRASDEEPTNNAGLLPVQFGEHLGVIEESIDSLRANMRAASDETAMMDQSDSVVAVSSAVSQAAEHVERARDALRALHKIMPK